ncbi:hypothetical protein [Streptomyces sp. XH2]|uniref:hypothetical protein n=1 Tax=Streptomyces sp. XH2 TaxID=3412483 RepID=UPI003C7CD342
MADLWVMGTSMHKNRSGPLVRADAITHLMASTEKVTASQIGSDDAITLVHRDSVGHGYQGPHPVPEDFHLALLAKLPEARRQAQGSEEDLILFPGLDDNQQWDWSVMTVTELWTG